MVSVNTIEDFAKEKRFVCDDIVWEKKTFGYLF